MENHYLKLIYSILSDAGFDVELCVIFYKFIFRKLFIKIGITLELSSFQLENIDKFQPNISILLNFSPDHLDRYNFDENKYLTLKCAYSQIRKQ